ncbi:hypothetical protein H8E77_09855 [bacterium]|nr:hypothetical protein [bacterium]
MGRVITFCVFLFMFLSFSAHATEQVEHPDEVGAVIPAVFLSAPPIIDGELDDSCWKEVPSVNDFYETSKGIPATEPTTAWIAYDGINVYVAFKCVDSRPETIRRQQRKRGGDIWGDDFVGVDFDSYHAHGDISWFDVTARGTQTENIAGGTGTKIEWIGDWQAAAKLQADGWTAEMAIPFSLLKYHTNQTVMGVAFVRRHPRSGEMWVCPNVGPTFNVSLFYDWTGLRLPKIRPRPFIMGYSLAEKIPKDLDKTKKAWDFQAGLDVKCRFTSDLIGVATVYPDFKNVEQQVESIDFSYAKIWYPDRRPFFQEGKGYMAGDSLFYSRNIGEIDAGAKFFGKAGNFKLGVLDVLDIEEVNHLVGKFGQSFADKGGWDVDFVSRANDAQSNNHAARLSGWLAKRGEKRSYNCNFGLAKSLTEGTGGDGSIKSVYFSTEGGPRMISVSTGYEDINKEYNSLDGFVPEVDKVGGWAEIGYHDEFEKGLIQGWNINLNGNRYEHHDNSLFYQGISISAGTWTRGETGCNLSLSASDRMSDREKFSDKTCRLGIYWLGSDLYRSGGTSLKFGRRAGGNYVYTSLSQGFAVTDDWTSRLNVEYRYMSSQQNHSDWQVVFSTNYTITDERGLGARIVAHGENTKVNLREDINVNLMFRQAVRKGMDVFFIYGNPNAKKTEHRFALKIVLPLYS